MGQKESEAKNQKMTRFIWREIWCQIVLTQISHQNPGKWFCFSPFLGILLASSYIFLT